MVTLLDYQTVRVNYMSNGRRHLSAGDFQHDGWLQEANRRFFHPRNAMLKLVAPDSQQKLVDVLRFVLSAFELSTDMYTCLSEWTEMLTASDIVVQCEVGDDPVIFGPAIDIGQSIERQRKYDAQKTDRSVEPINEITAIMECQEDGEEDRDQ